VGLQLVESELAWSDAHIPPRGDVAALAASSASLLGPDEISATLRAAGDVPRIAVKIFMRPKDASVHARLAVARAALDQVDLCRAQVPLTPTQEVPAGTSQTQTLRTQSGRRQ